MIVIAVRTARQMTRVRMRDCARFTAEGGRVSIVGRGAVNVEVATGIGIGIVKPALVIERSVSLRCDI